MNYPPNYQQPPASPDYSQGQPGYPYQQPYPGQYQQPPQYQPPPVPQSPVKPPKKGPGKLIGIVTLVIIVIVVIAVAASNHSSSPNTATSSVPANSTTPGTTATSAPSAPINQHFKVGDTVTIGSTWKAVVNSVTTDDGGPYSGLKSGDTYLVVDLSLTNLSSTEQTVSSLLSFTLQDSTGQKYNESFDTNITTATIDGKVEAGSPLRGVIVYEVPASMKAFTFSFAPDITASGQTVWDLSLP